MSFYVFVIFCNPSGNSPLIFLYVRNVTFLVQLIMDVSAKNNRQFGIATTHLLCNAVLSFFYFATIVLSVAKCQYNIRTHCDVFIREIRRNSDSSFLRDRNIS